jgi:peptidyl-tRNA hydrolase
MPNKTLIIMRNDIMASKSKAPAAVCLLAFLIVIVQFAQL